MHTHTERWSTNLSQHSCSFWSTQLPVFEQSTSTSCIFHLSLSSPFQAAFTAGWDRKGFRWVLAEASNQIGAVSPTPPFWAQLQRGELGLLSRVKYSKLIDSSFKVKKLTEVSLLQVRVLLDQVFEKLVAFSEVGISPAHADHIFCELTSYEKRVCVSINQHFTIKALSDRGMNRRMTFMSSQCVLVICSFCDFFFSQLQITIM